MSDAASNPVAERSRWAGLPALVAETIDGVEDGMSAEIDIAAGRLTLPGRELALEPIPANLAPMLAAGGLVPFLKQRFQEAT